jgi:RNA polymerase sigma-70 factor (ECF subfamily)
VNAEPVVAPTRPGCRPGGCAGLCTGDGLARAYRTHRAALLGRAWLTLDDRGLAEEVVQETFVRAWRSCASFDPAGPPLLAWLRSIQRNLALDRIRARSRRPSAARSTPGEDAMPTRTHEADVLLRIGLADAMAGLRTDQRRAVLETVVRDRPHDEVAAELGIPVGTLRSRAHYGLRRMRRFLEAADAADAADVIGRAGARMGSPHRSAPPHRARTLVPVTDERPMAER